jgi:dimethylglycine dehydrogenase
VTSGGFGHHVGASLALAYVDREVTDAPAALTVEVMGEARPSQILPGPAYDPAGKRLRDA